MLERQEFLGLWWLPGAEGDKVAGTLRIENGDARLETLGHFGRELLSETPREKSYSLATADQDRVLGTSTDGKDITLERVQSFGNTVHMPGIPTSRYRAGIALIGRHYPGGEEIRFDEVAVAATDLNAWTRVSGFKLSTEFEKLEGGEGLAQTALEFRYDAPEDLTIPLSRGEEMSIRFSAPSKGLAGGTDRVDIRQEATLHLRFARQAGLDDLFLRASQIRNFLSLAVGRPVSVTSVAGLDDGYTRGPTSSLRPVELYWQIPHNPEPPTDRRSPHDMFFTIAEAKPDISTVLNKWFLRQRHLEPVFNLYFGTRYHPDLYSEVRFLAYSQAIETYDYRRRRKPGRKPLAARLRDVLDQSRTVARRITGPSNAEINKFILDFRDTRNYYTHYDPKLERKAASGTGLLLLTLQLQAIIEMSILRELGFPSRGIDQILERCRRYEQIDLFRSQVETQGTEDDSD